MKDPFADAIEEAMKAAIKKASEQFEQAFFMENDPRARHIRERLERSPYGNNGFPDEPLIEQKDWRVGYFRELNAVDIYHRHGWGPFKKWHYCVFFDKGESLGESRIYSDIWKGSIGNHKCAKCEEKVPSEIMTAIQLLIET